MRQSYRNVNGEIVNVTLEHLQTSLKIKLDIQKENGGRTKWTQHKLRMEKEGFYDSENSNIYRSLIHDFETDISDSEIDEVATKSLKGVQERLGLGKVQKQDINRRSSEFSRLQKELINESLMANEVGDAFRDFFESGKFDITPAPLDTSLKLTKNKLVVPVSDWHVGAVVDMPHNKYDYSIARRVVAEFAVQVVNQAIMEEVDEVHIVHLGDLVEHITMRYAQAFSVEFTLAEQIVKATELLIMFLTTVEQGLTGRGVKISFAGINGNHDRMESDKNKLVSGDSAGTIIYHGVENFIKYSNSEIEFVKADKYAHKMEVNGKWIKFIHGDLDGIKNKDLMGKHSNLDGVIYSLILSGHIHHNSLLEVGQGRYQVSVGSTKGADDYSDKIRAMSSKSQTIVSVNHRGDFNFRIVNLDD